jgi:hypothetical protein
MLPLPSHVASIQEFPRPSVIKELQAFLGMVNFYRRFLHSIAHKRRPLTDGLRGSKKGSDKLKWLAAMDAAFAGAKQALLSASPGPPKVRSGLICGGGLLRDTHGRVCPAEASWQERLAALGILLKEARGCPAEVLCLQQGALRLLLWNQTLPVHAGWPPF